MGVSASVEVNDLSFFRKACLGGLWEWPRQLCGWRLGFTGPGFDAFRFLQNQKIMDGMEVGWATLLNKIARWSYLLGQKNTIQGSRKNISLHYDLGMTFYELMLDPTMTYSCGIFESASTTLMEASIAKYDRIIEQLRIELTTR